MGSQETRCRDYARYHGYEIVKVFKDDKTGEMINRPGMNAMLAFLRQHKSNPHIVIIDDLNRLSRSVKAHIALREGIAAAGGILKSPSIDFGDDADSELQEFLMATVSQHQRRKNAEQTLNRMQSRMRNGFWVFQAPIGYCYAKHAGGGKILIRDEPLASIIQEGLEGFASGRFGSQAELVRFFEQYPAFPRDKHGDVRFQRVNEILSRTIYAGYLDHAAWGVRMLKGQHEPLISLEAHHQIQDRLSGKNRVPARKDVREDFPLRGFIKCGDCGNPLTANWSKSKTGKKHPYYLCFTKGCPSYRKSIRRDALEGDFGALLKRMQPAQKL
ncbi:MAG: recombinase family protein, partial [Pseudomonadota bacterium]